MCECVCGSSQHRKEAKENRSSYRAHFDGLIYNSNDVSSLTPLGCMISFHISFSQFFFFLFFPPYEFMLPVFIFWCSRPVCCVGGFRVHPVDRKDESSQFFFLYLDYRGGKFVVQKLLCPFCAVKGGENIGCIFSMIQKSFFSSTFEMISLLRFNPLRYFR